jgi:hypothetical protein
MAGWAAPGNLTGILGWALLTVTALLGCTEVANTNMATELASIRNKFVTVSGDKPTLKQIEK